MHDLICRPITMSARRMNQNTFNPTHSWFHGVIKSYELKIIHNVHFPRHTMLPWECCTDREKKTSQPKLFSPQTKCFIFFWFCLLRYWVLVTSQESWLTTLVMTIGQINKEGFVFSLFWWQFLMNWKPNGASKDNSFHIAMVWRNCREMSSWN